MTTQIKVLAENLIKQLSSLDEDNVGIAGIEFSRKKLLVALKLQKDADVMIISYGMWSYHYDYEHKCPETGWQGKDGIIRNWESTGSVKVDYPARWEYKPYTREPTPCIQFEMTANGVHQIMRFAHSPVTTRPGNGKTKHLRFIDYTETPKPKVELTGIPLDTAELIRALQFALSGVATEESRPVLCCVLFDCGNDVIRLVGADGFRLPIATIPALGVAVDKILIHSSDITRLIKFLKGTITGRGKSKCYPDVFLSVGQDNTTVYFAAENGKIHFDRRDFTFPNYSQLIPTEGTKIEFVASELLQTTESLNGFSKDGSGIIRLEFNDNKIKASARSEYGGESTAEMDAKVPDARKIGLNAKFLTDAISACPSTQLIMEFSGALSACLIKPVGVEGLEYIVMPVRLS